MRNILLTLMITGSLFASNTLSVLSVAVNADDNSTVDITLGYNFTEDVAGFQFDLLSDGNLTLSDNAASGGAAADAGFTMSTNATGRVIGFSFTGAVIPAGSGTFCVLNGTTEAATGTIVNLTAVEDCASDGSPDCNGASDTRLVLSDTAAQPLVASFLSGMWTVGDNTLGNDLPVEFGLSANYPNPFNPTTTIDYSIATAGDVSIVVYDMMGREVKSLVSDFATPGTYSVVWDATNNEGLSVAAGMYVYKMISSDFVEVNKMLLVK